MLELHHRRDFLLSIISSILSVCNLITILVFFVVIVKIKKNTEVLNKFKFQGTAALIICLINVIHLIIEAILLKSQFLIIIIMFNILIWGYLATRNIVLYEVGKLLQEYIKNHMFDKYED